MSYEDRYDILFQEKIAQFTPIDLLDAISEGSPAMLETILARFRESDHAAVGTLISALISNYASLLTELAMPSEDEYDREVAEAAAEDAADRRREEELLRSSSK